MVQLYSDPEFLVETVAQYVGSGLKLGEGAIVIARPEHRARFARALEREALYPSPALRMLVAIGELPGWTACHQAVSSTIGELSLEYPAVRINAEMVDIFWPSGEQ